MPAGFSDLDAAVSALTAQVEQTEGVEASAEALIRGVAAKIEEAVTAALEADANADQASIDAASAAIATVTNRLVASSSKLGEAINA